MAVLILILLEYGLRPTGANPFLPKGTVLILILLEYGLRPWQQLNFATVFLCLNPYSIGIWSATYGYTEVSIFMGGS